MFPPITPQNTTNTNRKTGPAQAHRRQYRNVSTFWPGASRWPATTADMLLLWARGNGWPWPSAVTRFLMTMMLGLRNRHHPPGWEIGPTSSALVRRRGRDVEDVPVEAPAQVDVEVICLRVPLEHIGILLAADAT